MERVASNPCVHHLPTRHCQLRTVIAVVAWLTFCFVGNAFADDAADHFFETEIRPILVEHCVACHGATEQSGGLRLDSKAGLLKGGDSGLAAGLESAESLLLEAVRRSENLAMPPDEPLQEQQVAAIAKWVAMGLPWPESSGQLRSAAMENAKEH